jgi:small subunit ribosomal protein S8
LNEQLIFPEIQYDQIDQLHGIGLSIVLTSQTTKESQFLLKRLGIPFRNYPYSQFFIMPDTLSLTLTRIRNAVRVKRPYVEIPETRLTLALIEILIQEGLIEERIQSFSSQKIKRHLGLRTPRPTKQLFRCIRLKYYDGVSAITCLQQVSRPGLRIYAKKGKLPKSIGGLGVVVVSTNKGLLTDRAANNYNVGGEVLCSIWLFRTRSTKKSALST